MSGIPKNHGGLGYSPVEPTFLCPYCNCHIPLDGVPANQARFEHEGEKHD